MSGPSNANVENKIQKNANDTSDTNNTNDTNTEPQRSDRIYYYGCDGYDDFGWGCVYRNTQTVLARGGVPVPTIPKMMQTLGVPINRSHSRLMWIEPVDAKKLIPWTTRLIAYAPDPSLARPRMARTTWDDFDRVYASESDMHVVIMSACVKKNYMLI